jgi:hypothetical protein
LTRRRTRRKRTLRCLSVEAARKVVNASAACCLLSAVCCLPSVVSCKLQHLPYPCIPHATRCRLSSPFTASRHVCILTLLWRIDLLIYHRASETATGRP